MTRAVLIVVRVTSLTGYRNAPFSSFRFPEVISVVTVASGECIRTAQHSVVIFMKASDLRLLVLLRTAPLLQQDRGDALPDSSRGEAAGPWHYQRSACGSATTGI